MKPVVGGRWSGIGRFVFALGVFSAAAVVPRTVRAQDLGIQVGAAAPEAKVYALDGKEANLSQYIGKTPIVMEFWATWCPNCKELEPTVVQLAKKYATQVKFVGVAVSVNESPERVKLYVEKHSLPGDHYFDT